MEDLKNILKYNPDTDYFGFTYNGTYYDVVAAGVKELDLLQLSYYNTNKFSHVDGTNKWSVGQSSVWAGYYTGTSTSEEFDCTPYNKLSLNVDYIQPGGNGDTNITIDLINSLGEIVLTITTLTNTSAGTKLNKTLSVDVSNLDQKLKARLSYSVWSISYMVATFNLFTLSR